MNEANKFLGQIYNAKLYKAFNIERWASRNSIKKQNDGEHQCIVTQLAIMLCEHFNVGVQTYRDAVALSAIHDMFEYTDGGMGDVPHHVKEKNPRIKELVEKHEKSVILNKPIFGSAYAKFSENKLAVKIMELADAIDVILYIERELELGNQNREFMEIFNETVVRYVKGYKELKRAINR